MLQSAMPNVCGALRQDLQVAYAGNSADTSKLQVSPLRRQKTPPPVEMAVYGKGRKEPYHTVCEKALTWTFLTAGLKPRPFKAKTGRDVFVDTS